VIIKVRDPGERTHARNSHLSWAHLTGDRPSPVVGISLIEGIQISALDGPAIGGCYTLALFPRYRRPLFPLMVQRVLQRDEALTRASGEPWLTSLTINPQTGQMMVAASQAANGPQGSAMGKIIAFARAAGTVAVLTVHPQSATP
jgi:hypothetical protein